MAKQSKIPQSVYNCWYCNKRAAEVKYLIEGPKLSFLLDQQNVTKAGPKAQKPPNLLVCNECVSLCMEICIEQINEGKYGENIANLLEDNPGLKEDLQKGLEAFNLLYGSH